MSGGEPTRGRAHALWKVVFGVYVVVIATATHWPQLKINMPGRPDLWIHMTVFSLWTFLVAMPAWFGPRWSRENIGTCAIIALAYTALDESTQAFSPGRTVALDDFGANAAGVLLGSVVLLVISSVLKKRRA